MNPMLQLPWWEVLTIAILLTILTRLHINGGD